MTARVAISAASRRRSPVTAAPTTRQETSTTTAPKLRYIVVTLAGIFAILGGQLLLSISVSSGAYEISSLKGEMRQSEQSLQIVAEEIGALTAPDTLASLAGSMGMVEDNNPAIVTDVFASLSAQAAYELSAEDALRAANVPVVDSGEAAIHTAMVTQPVPVATFGGSIPSPITR
jgi:hypothetical protein